MKLTQWFKRCWNSVAVYLIFENRRRPGLTGQDLKNAEFKTSTQEMGLRMTDQVRNVFRFRWLRRH